MWRYVMVLGFVIFNLMMFWPTLKKWGFGRLPGDIEVKRKSGASFYFPLATCLVLTWLLNALIWFLSR